MRPKTKILLYLEDAMTNIAVDDTLIRNVRGVEAPGGTNYEISAR
jgi:hypothetical protein